MIVGETEHSRGIITRLLTVNLKEKLKDLTEPHCLHHTAPVVQMALAVVTPQNWILIWPCISIFKDDIQLFAAIK
jgi:hypothetical protein